MDTVTTILKNRELPQSQDYEFLRSEGLKYIENLGSSLWTDYNEHDPGITILEALCYAITELGYRTGFDMKDLLTKEDGNCVEDQAFFSAKNILTINPVTINDYRKLLIDTNGVHNAWLFAADTVRDEHTEIKPVNEIPIYADCKNDKLTFEKTNNPLFLSGLYRVLLDLDLDDRYGDLNNGEIIKGNPANDNFADSEFLFSVNLPSWKDGDFKFASSASDEANINTVSTIQEGSQWKCTVLLLDGSSINFMLSLAKKTGSGKVESTDIASMFDNNKTFIAALFNDYHNKIKTAKGIVQVVTKKLHDHRNLCEDFISVSTIDDEKIAFCFDVDVEASTDIEKVQAEVFYAIENYLNPSVDFFTLQEMLHRKIPVDEIFEGPVLHHGFLDTSQLESTKPREIIYSSDIINLLMDIGGVTSIRNFLMTKYDKNGRPVAGYVGKKWCMNVSMMHKPVLSIEGSKILLFKNQLPFIADYSEMHDTLSLLYAERSRDKLKGIYNDLPFPAGQKRDTTSYWPVQYDLPETYGTGEFGLPASATEHRKAQQAQLKAYLMFYEQLIADFFSNLTNAHKLLSTGDIKSTYHAQFLENIKDIHAVYKSASGVPMLRTILQTPDSTTQSTNAWQALYESKDKFEERRNRFLDHLLARFGESFNEYALMMYRLNHAEKTEEKIDPSEIIQAKKKMLKNYDAISSSRFRAFNYFPQKDDLTVNDAELWDTDNVSGLEKRISMLTGINDATRRFLYCISNFEIICTEEAVEADGEETLKCFHSFSFTSLGGITLNSEKYENKADAEKAAYESIRLGGEKDNYTFNEADSTLSITGPTHVSLVKSVTTFLNKDAAMNAALDIAKEFSTKCGDPVGLHLIEHILLRPRDATFSLMEVCLDGCECLCEQDPYSFRASVVLPYWPGHFDSMPFREYFENKIREEAPAHIMLKVCWLNNNLMRQFETAYNKWISALAAYSFDDTTNLTGYMNANNEMINILKNLHSKYPVANLHDCIESKEGSNTVVLGKTILGTFKN